MLTSSSTLMILILFHKVSYRLAIIFILANKSPQIYFMIQIFVWQFIVGIWLNENGLEVLGMWIYFSVVTCL